MATADGNDSRCGSSLACELHHDLDGDRPISATIIDAVAAAEGVDPTDCTVELYEVIDLEAFDVLFERRSLDDHWRFEFTVSEYRVVIDGRGRVAVHDRE
ncbi:HalOD1 output domain-containing protein [Halorussus amylolyticus]|uniref:HalOD1 output domain-containing protein n=1 Tax=Halorussus amylolyticus TaxID=1126242 RepID=UPI00138F5F7D|nr:HalOD1 output domain-containing protein [Halorussus amylolyticus]